MSGASCSIDDGCDNGGGGGKLSSSNSLSATDSSQFATWKHKCIVIINIITDMHNGARLVKISWHFQHLLPKK